MMGPWDSWGPWDLAMSIGSLLFLALIVIGIVMLVRGPSAGSESRREGPSAAQILDERFARGEIDEEEYRSRTRALADSGRM